MKQRRLSKMANVKLFKTKAGKGFKIVVGDEWFYTSIPELMKLVEGAAKACPFRSIEDSDERGHPDHQGDFPIVEDIKDDDFFPQGDTGIIGDLHAFQDHLLKEERGGQK
jgi:hypothetical protein